MGMSQEASPDQADMKMPTNILKSAKSKSLEQNKTMNLHDAAAASRAAKTLSLFNRKVQKKTVKLEEASPPKTIKRYLKTMTKSTFRGDVDGKNDTIDSREKQRRIDLGIVMKKLYLLIEAGKAFSQDTDATISELARLRSAGNNVSLDEESYKEKLDKDYKRFLDLREDSMLKVEESKLSSSPLKPVAPLQHDDFWGTRQQLRSGKVVGDMLGGIDPVFGSMLNPTGGRIGKGDSKTLHNMLYKKDDPLAYHAAVHDAFGYLIQHHGKGPGYNYLNTKWTFFRKESPMSCQAAGVKFWKKALKRRPVEKEF